ncbi:hypothetical protein N1851_034494 [Merluccius polli]|uniref:Uncharacterized protein n=1 Tax=Merluccius polli TaxID=89951 RepID=A0AA47LZJ6_MERPO|nr:hypothetical protein N1851_034494 [Merluccius polli]
MVGTVLTLIASMQIAPVRPRHGMVYKNILLESSFSGVHTKGLFIQLSTNCLRNYKILLKLSVPLSLKNMNQVLGDNDCHVEASVVEELATVVHDISSADIISADMAIIFLHIGIGPVSK